MTRVPPKIYRADNAADTPYCWNRTECGRTFTRSFNRSNVKTRHGTVWRPQGVMSYVCTPLVLGGDFLLMPSQRDLTPRMMSSYFDVRWRQWLYVASLLVVSTSHPERLLESLSYLLEL